MSLSRCCHVHETLTNWNVTTRVLRPLAGGCRTGVCRVVAAAKGNAGPQHPPQRLVRKVQVHPPGNRAYPCRETRPPRPPCLHADPPLHPPAICKQLKMASSAHMLNPLQLRSFLDSTGVAKGKQVCARCLQIEGCVSAPRRLCDPGRPLEQLDQARSTESGL